jgi:acyl-coenzyme A synthetase/AMP-(fatty) acid ligase
MVNNVDSKNTVNIMESLLESIKKYAINQPAKLCVVDYNGNKYTYGEYWNLIIGIADYFKKIGLKKNDYVVVETVQSGLFTATAFGIQLAGGIFIPVEKKIQKERLEKIYLEINAKFVITVNRKINNKNCHQLSDIAKYANMVITDLEQFSMPHGNELAEILFTTGTTGDEKGIMMSFEGDVALAENISYGVEMKPNNIELIPVPISHSYGLRSFYASMFNGSSVILLDGFANFRNFFMAIEKYSVTSVALVPAIINMILKISKDYIKKYSKQLDYIQSGSAALPEESKKALCNLLTDSRLYNFYGSTESGRCCLLNYNKEKNKTRCIGKPAYNASIAIVDDKRHIINSSRDNIGRLACKGKMNMIGYRNDPATTKKVLSEEGYIITSDFCYIEDDYVYYVGRQDDVINVGGNKVSPMEIEEVANGYKSILESVCVPIDDELIGQCPKLFVLMKEKNAFNKIEIIKYLSKTLEEFKVPKIIEEISEIPRMYNGKIDRKLLK